MAIVQVILRFLLLVHGELAASRDTLPAHLEACVGLGDTLLLRVKAVHAAPGGLVIHHVEFFVEEREKVYLTIFHALLQQRESLFVHVVHYLLSLGDPEVITCTLMRLHLLVGEVDLGLVSDLLERCLFVFLPRVRVRLPALLLEPLFLSLEELRLQLVVHGCMCSILLSLFPLSLLGGLHFIFEVIQVPEVDGVMTIEFAVHLIPHGSTP